MKIDLDALQRSVSKDFKKWHAALADETLTQKDYKEIRQRIMNKARDSLGNYALESKGIYLFYDRRAKGTGELIYIGIVGSGEHTLKRRMLNHLVEDLSSLNVALHGIDDSAAESKIGEIIRSVLPSSTKHAQYTRTHMKARAMGRATDIFVFPTTSDGSTIRAAERALIQVAVKLEAEESILVNLQGVRDRRAIPAGGITLAQEAVDYWRKDGLRENLCDALRTGLNEMQSAQMT